MSTKSLAREAASAVSAECRAVSKTAIPAPASRADVNTDVKHMVGVHVTNECYDLYHDIMISHYLDSSLVL